MSSRKDCRAAASSITLNRGTNTCARRGSTERSTKVGSTRHLLKLRKRNMSSLFRSSSASFLYSASKLIGTSSRSFPSAHLFCETAGLQARSWKSPREQSASDQRSVRSGTKFFARYGLAAQHWEATSV